MDRVIGPREQASAFVTNIRKFFDRVLDAIPRAGDHRGCLICNTALERGGASIGGTD
jgi:hypothetical protein